MREMNRRFSRKTWISAVVLFALFFAITSIFQNCSLNHLQVDRSGENGEFASSVCKATEYLDSSGRCVPMVCQPSTSTTVGCEQITNGMTQKTCDIKGSSYGSYNKCNNGFVLLGVVPQQICQVLPCANKCDKFSDL